MSFVPHFTILIPLLFLGMSFLFPILNQLKRCIIPRIARYVAGLNLVLAVITLYYVKTKGPFSYHFGGWENRIWGIEFYVTELEAFLLTLFLSMIFLILIYSKSLLKAEVKNKVIGLYYTLLFLLLSSLVGMIATNDFFNLFVFMEISALTSVAIISVKDDRECIDASVKYLFLTAIGSSLFLLSIGILYMVTGHLNMNEVREILPAAIESYPQTVGLSMVIMFFGLALKSALFPLHIWLPDAYSKAPMTSTLVMAGVVGKVYIINAIKILYRVYTVNLLHGNMLWEVILILSALAIVIGSIFAIGQKSVKRLLAYSSIAQVGYIFLGIALVTESGLTGGLLHIFNHALVKSLLFLTSGIIIIYGQENKVRKFDGIGRKYPIVMLSFSFAALSMVGIPPLNGFISKWILAMSTLDAGRPIYLFVIILSSLMNGIYYLPIIIRSFFKGEDKSYNWEFGRLPGSILFPVVAFTAAIILFGIMPQIPLSIIEPAAESLMNF
ncbi:MAG: proton-conducting transporter membrane subunit [Halanaerobiales bacterium]